MSLSKRQTVCVLGAGIAGVTTAWHLRERGFDVFVIEREESAGLGTSFANGAQISVSNATPWSAPHALKRVLHSLVGQESGLFISPRLSLKQWIWGMRFLWNCRSTTAQKNLEKMLAICLRSRELYNALINEYGIEFSCYRNGILHLYFDEAEYQVAKYIQSHWGKALSTHRKAVNATEILSIEPALASIGNRIVGGFYAPQDMTGDAHQFIVALASLCADRDVAFHYETQALELHPTNRKLTVVTDRGEYNCDHLVCCIGVHSDYLLKPLGIKTYIYPVKGYSITVKLDDLSKDIPTVSILDESNKIVMSYLGDSLRIAGIAEIGDDSITVSDRRIALLTNWAHDYFPQISLQDFSAWAGLRPVTPTNLPYVGISRCPRVWLNCGHGTLGWTAAMGTAEQVASDIIKHG